MGKSKINLGTDLGNGPVPVRYRSKTKPDPKLKFFLDNFHQQDLGINGQNVLGSIVWIIRLNFHKDSSDAENAVSTTSKHPLRNIHFEIFTSKHSIRNILFPTRNEYLKILFRVNNFGILVAVKHFKQFQPRLTSGKCELTSYKPRLTAENYGI